MRRNILTQFLGGVVLAISLLPTLSFAKTLIVYPRYQFDPESDADSKYAVQLLSLCLGKTGEEFELQMSKPPRMQQGRAILQLRKGLDIDVLWTMTSKEREDMLLPIRIPIDRGALGWRIFLINKDAQQKFDKVKTFDDLKKLLVGSETQWPDTNILSANNLPVVRSPNYSGLIGMLKANRFDYLPRSMIEIWEEAAMYASKGLVVEKTIALHYPVPSYFFVNKSNLKLAAQLKDGCEKAIKDGSFRKLFDKFYGQHIIQADLKNRKVFHLQNPLLTPETPLNRKEYWFSEDQR